MTDSINSGRRYYLEDLPLDEAWRRFDNALCINDVTLNTKTAILCLQDALGRVTAGPIWALSSSPHYDAAAMDGIAVRSADTIGATETSPKQLAINEAAIWVDTGDPIPNGFNAVVMIEHVHSPSSDLVEIREPAAPYQHVRPIGEDITATELVLPAGHILRPQDLGACAACGVTKILVREKPSIAIIPTGTELVDPGDTPSPGQVIEYNSIMLAAQITDWGGHPIRLKPVADDLETIKKTIWKSSQEHEIVVVNAGSSAGSEDYTARAVESLGELAVHGVAIRPGHPVVLGVVNNTPVIGLPGYPVSTLVTAELFLKTIVERCLGISGPHRRPFGHRTGSSKNQTAKAIVTRKTPSPAGEDEFLRVRLGVVDGRLVATPIRRGAGVIMSLVEADGIALIPRFSEGVEAGEEIQVEIIKSINEIENTLLVTGSHDISLDILASLLSQTGITRLTSSSVGSLGGLMALERGEAHIAGAHLLYPETGEYNIPYICKNVTRPTTVVTLVHRIQGLIISPGNPLALESLSDLATNRLAFVNRQRGSGTRLLLDHELSRLQIDPFNIEGYRREEYTHLAVAATVAAGKADVGMGIKSAARAFGLDFIPVTKERYDLIIPHENMRDYPIAAALAVINSDDFKAQVDTLGGYDTAETGNVVAQLAGQS